MNNHEKPGDLYKVNKVQEELLMKSNLDYENRLRGHMYQFDEHENNVWSLVLGKFTLAFSSAPEFYRQVYKKNPSTCFNVTSNSEHDFKLSKTSWQEIVDKGVINGND